MQVQQISQSDRLRQSLNTPVSQTWTVTDPRELATHELSISYPARSQHVLGTLWVDVSVGHVQRLCLIQPIHGCINITGMLSTHASTLSQFNYCQHASHTRDSVIRATIKVKWWWQAVTSLDIFGCKLLTLTLNNSTSDYFLDGIKLGIKWHICLQWGGNKNNQAT